MRGDKSKRNLSCLLKLQILFTRVRHCACLNVSVLQVGGDNFEVVAYLNRGGAGIDRNGDTLGPDVVLDTSQQQLAEVR